MICEGCNGEESTTKHTLHCNSLLRRNKLVTFIPDISDVFGQDEDEQEYIARVLQKNIGKLQKQWLSYHA